MTETQQVPVNAAADGRDHVRDLIAAHRPQVDELSVMDALLVTSELVTNAQRHGGGIAGFFARIVADCLEVTVIDYSPRHPSTVAGREKYAVGGYGWPMIQQLATGIAIARTADGKAITVTMSLAGDRSPG
ncbi:ATP-binding protein [Streptomyces sp. NPDC048650]|uniref:ATP-binding protein n=1 Tax=unclassified Streptomyces TaxID=2593676 RepID=UPI00371BA17E